jgi:hypothetical protein
VPRPSACDAVCNLLISHRPNMRNTFSKEAATAMQIPSIGNVPRLRQLSKANSWGPQSTMGCSWNQQSASNNGQDLHQNKVFLKPVDPSCVRAAPPRPIKGMGSGKRQRPLTVAVPRATEPQSNVQRASTMKGKWGRNNTCDNKQHPTCTKIIGAVLPKARK